MVNDGILDSRTPKPDAVVATTSFISASQRCAMTPPLDGSTTRSLWVAPRDTAMKCPARFEEILEGKGAAVGHPAEANRLPPEFCGGCTPPSPGWASVRPLVAAASSGSTGAAAVAPHHSAAPKYGKGTVTVSAATVAA